MSSEPNKQSPPSKDGSLTRIPVKWMRFKDMYDLPANPSQSNVKGYPFPEKNPKWYSIVFIPAWQQFEVTLMNNDQPVINNDVQPEMIPVGMVYKWWRA